MSDIDRIAAAAAAMPHSPGEGLLVVTAAAPALEGSLLVPANLGTSGPTSTPGSSGLMRYMGVQISTADYVYPPANPPSAEQRRRDIEKLVASHDRITLIHVLAELASFVAQPALMPELIANYREFLPTFNPAFLPRFDFAMAQHEGRVSFLDRQLVLAAMREVLAHPETANPPRNLPPRMAGLMLAHVIAGDFDADNSRDDGAWLSGFPEDLALDMVRNQTFHDAFDLYAVIDRQLRLWRDYGPRVASKLGGRTPMQVLTEATGIDLEDFLALGFALLAHFLGWKPDGRIRLNDNVAPSMPAAVQTRFFELISASLDELAQQCADPARSKWDFLAFQDRPVLHHDDSLMVLDGNYLIDRVTSGLYWFVHDHLKATEEDAARDRWTQAWGEMIEAMAEDDLRPHAPSDVTGAPTFFEEEDLRGAYPGKKNADCVIDFGDSIGVFEIVSGRLVNATRIDGDRAAFESDMEKIALKKVRQLDESVTCLLDNLSALIPGHADPGAVQPVIVAGGGFPVSPIATRYIEEYCRTNDHLQDARIRALAVIDLGDLEVLEGLAQDGHAMLDLLAGWKASDLADLSLRNYLLETYPWDPERYRPDRMRPRVNAAFAEIKERLGAPPNVAEQPNAISVDAT